MTSSTQVLDALVIGAGPAGIGTALALAAVKGLTFGVLERGQVGQTFLDWPENQRFLTPSFTGNGFGATDLNSVHPATSPAFSLGTDYLTGEQYARYLRSVVSHFQVPVMDDAEVTAVTTHEAGFEVFSDRGPVVSRSLVWAGGEFHHPLAPRLAGSGFSDHSSTKASWERRTGELVVIGGYESGIDIACHHVSTGVIVTVVDAEHPWGAGSGSDPSFRLAPRSRIRLNAALETGRLTLMAARAVGIQALGNGAVIRLSDGSALTSRSRPIAAVGFGPGLGPVDHLFTARPDGWPLLDTDDQSTTTPGLFLSGPAIRHGGVKFCFVYKFRQRFAHIARVIGDRAGKDTTQLEAWREAGMLTEDLSCCGVECAC
ncbi:pyridine nucleotide-disulfide oxidoreductase [Glaciihabitans sp. INWT7]|uniref:NAD(P)/FAD-dependent oxidoreductase n=1 Tax=Glaciihabitans sp. INWT7 TaxID=2596912 RepID=UPI0016258ABE|nr:NAD(P)/FAD-dependent oxidoreductase [Glaciihabitans sp. INWT7]QNE46157.1 pyridine nucleotide-disulfide oxidoreductase [Glaciihabitans sp. INWT7]